MPKNKFQKGTVYQSKKTCPPVARHLIARQQKEIGHWCFRLYLEFLILALKLNESIQTVAKGKLRLQ